MPLPHFHTMPPADPAPIMTNLFETIAIFEDNRHIVLNIEKFDISNNLINCKIQENREYGYSDIIQTKILMLEYYDRKGYIIKCDIFRVKNISYESSLDWNDTNKLSVIDASFKIEESNILKGDQMLTRSSIIKSILREEKLNKLLD